MEISLRELERVNQILLEYLHDQKVESIKFSCDYYWEISADNEYDNYNEPDDHTLGQLSDDWAFLKKLINNETEPIAYHFKPLASIFKAIGNDLAKLS